MKGVGARGWIRKKIGTRRCGATKLAGFCCVCSFGVDLVSLSTRIFIPLVFSMAVRGVYELQTESWRSGSK